MRANGGDMAANGADPLGLDFGRIYVQSIAQNRKVGVKQKCAVVHDATVADILGVAGDFLIADEDIVPAADAGICPQRTQRIRYGSAEFPEIHLCSISGIGDPGIIQIAEIVVYGTAAGQTADDPDPVLPNIRFVDFGQCVLVLADDDGVIVLPKKEILAASGEAVEDILLQRQIEVWVSRRDVDVYRVFQRKHILS